MKYVIEHMEAGFTEWVTLEYYTIIQEVGAENLILTSLPSTLKESDIPLKLRDAGLQWTTKEVTEIGTSELPIVKNRVCLLDPSAEVDLVPEDAGNFDYFVFGGILGDHPPRDRTGELRRKYGFEGRRLGDKQMTTDTAVRTTQLIVDKKIKFEDVKFIDYPEFRFNKYEATEMPFRYVLNESGRPILPDGMLALIEKDSQQSLDDLL
jgi:ribosome biogenesis SPOUT family RNA methylase Rps3